MKNKYSLLAIILFVIVALTHRDSYRAYLNKAKVLAYDRGGYYVYLPAYFLYNTADFSFIKKEADQSWESKVIAKNGETVYANKYSVGPAMLLAPFFGLGHLEAYYRQVPRDGFSYTYLFWLATGAIFYVTLALFLLRSVLLRYYDDLPVAITLLILGIGTNLLYYATSEFLMSHVHSFFLFSLALYLAIRWLETPKLSLMVALSLTAGLLAATRLPNMVYFVVLAFWGVSNIKELTERLLMFKRYWASLAMGFVLFFIPFIPQCIYLHAITGYYYMNVYASCGEYFFFLDPRMFEVLLGYRKGWLVYTPLMIFGFIGFYMLYKQQKQLFWTLFLYITINVYVVSCWSCWWYGGSFGMRALIESSVVMCVPMTAFMQDAIKNSVMSHLLSILVAAGIYLNMFQLYQYEEGVIHWGDNTKESYWAVFGVMPPMHPYHLEKRDKHLLKPTDGYRVSY